MSSNKSTARTFRVTNMANYTDNLKKLASLNPDWKLSPEEIVESGKTDQKIYKLRFTNRIGHREVSKNSKQDRSDD